MVIANTDLTFFQCNAGGPGTARIGNLGGPISATQIITNVRYNWYYDVTRAMMAGSWNTYCCMYIKNKNQAAGNIAYNVKVWIGTPYNNTSITTSIGVFMNGPSGAPVPAINATVTAIATVSEVPNNATSPTTPVSFTSGAISEATALSIGTLNPNDYCGVWVRLSGPSTTRYTAYGSLKVNVVYTDTLT